MLATCGSMAVHIRRAGRGMGLRTIAVDAEAEYATRSVQMWAQPR